MTVNVIWDNVEKTILRYDFDARWKVEDLYPALTLGKSMIDGVLYRENVGVLMIFHKNAHIPTDPLPLLRYALERQHHLVNIVVLVSDTLYMQVLWQTLREAFPVIGQTLLHTRTLEEGRTLATSYLGSRMLQANESNDLSLSGTEIASMSEALAAYNNV